MFQRSAVYIVPCKDNPTVAGELRQGADSIFASARDETKPSEDEEILERILQPRVICIKALFAGQLLQQMRAHQYSHVKALLSGGVDSFAVVSLLHKLSIQSDTLPSRWCIWTMVAASRVGQSVNMSTTGAGEVHSFICTTH